MTTTTTYLNTLRRELPRAIATRDATTGKEANECQRDAPQDSANTTPPSTDKSWNQ